jgi:DNA-binding protein Fis
MEATVKLTVKLPERLRRRAKAVAAIRGETVSAVVREALEEYVADIAQGDDLAGVSEVDGTIEADPILDMIAQFDSGQGDLAQHHDRYLADANREEDS